MTILDEGVAFWPEPLGFIVTKYVLTCTPSVTKA